MVPADDPSIAGNIGIRRGIKASQISLDTNGNEIISDGAFRTTGGLSAFREDLATDADVFKEYPQATRVARLTAQDVRVANCIIQMSEPPKGHVEIFRKDNPGQRISGGSAGQMAKKAKLTSTTNNSVLPF
jgi:hypothetical protein